ncbi:DNA polymerase Y family protein [Castellaniella sp. MT123]|uniref:Y-family DNA polymerase n=1 Tax=Castellaniella sp. MT123 TaxID=3140381 RepID=UPI0031F3BDEF
MSTVAGISADAVTDQDASVLAIASALLRFTPTLAIAPESVILMDVTASLRLFGGIRALRVQVRRVLAAFDRADVAVAASGPAAWVLARSGQGGSALTARSLRHALARVPLAVSPPARPFADWFRELGCVTLADLGRLPRIGLKKRCGPALLDWLDQLNDGCAHYRWLELPPTFDAGLELPDHIEHAPALQWAVRRLILQLCGWLTARQQDAAAFTLWLGHDRDRVPPWLPDPSTRNQAHSHSTHAEPDPATGTRLDILLGEPGRDPDSLTRLAKERLHRLTLPASVISVRLQVSQLRAAQVPSLDLFPEPGGTPQDHAHLLALLAARLGADHVLVAAPQADHRPEWAARWIPLDPSRPHTPGRAPASRTRHAVSMNPLGQSGLAESHAGSSRDTARQLDWRGNNSLPRPAWLLDAPVPLAMCGHRPCYGTPLRLVSTAERLDCGWQDGHPIIRDYFVAEDETGICYWIFRLGMPEPIPNPGQSGGAEPGPTPDSGTAQAPAPAPAPDAVEPHWYLHGLFG